MPTTSIDLRQSSLCTDNPTGSDLFPYAETPAQFVQNTGIERNGGITNLYLQTTTFTTAGVSTAIAKDGTVIQIDSSNNVRLDDTVVGNVGPYSIYARGRIPTCLDAAWTADSTVLMVNRSSSTLTVSEYDPFNATITNTRNIVFASFPSGIVLNLSFVRYVDMHYADNQEFVVCQDQSAGTPVAWHLKENGTSVSTIPSAGYGVFFAHRFSAGNYVWGRNGGTTFYVGGSVTSTATWQFPKYSDLTGMWAIIDRFPGTAYSRVICSTKLSLATIATKTWWCVGEAGHASSAGTFSATGTLYGVQTATTTVVITIATFTVGFGYSENCYTPSDESTQIYNIQGLCMSHTPGAYVYGTTTLPGTTGRIDTNTLTNGYGKLTDIYNNASSYVSWRAGFVGSQMAFLSAAVPGTGTATLPGTNDCIGIPITNIGEIDDSYTPHIDDNPTATYSRVLYKYNGQFFFVDIRATVSSLQKVSDNLYSINCLSPYNCVDLSNRQMMTGVTDYNGRITFASRSAATATAKIVCIGQYQNANSIDSGDKINTNLATATYGGNQSLVSQVWFPGIELPSFVTQLSPDWGFNIFVNDVYISTVISSKGSTTATFIDKSNLETLGYVPDTRIPIAQGSTFYDKVVQTEIETIFTGVGVSGSADIDYDYLCYEVGNDILGSFKAFILFGQIYIFDGNNIYLASFTGSLFGGKGSAPVTQATGMSFLGVSPTEAYFLSSFDNSIHVFNGGRALVKVKRLNSFDTISGGVYNVRDNTLLLNSANTWIWMRDNIFTANTKDAAQTSVSLYDTQQGITIANNTAKWIYSYASLSNSTVMPLTWQSAYHALKNNELSEAVNWVVTLYSPGGRISAAVTLTSHSFDQDGYASQAATITVNPGDWDELGFIRLRSQPAKRKILATSIQVYTTSHLVITDAAIEYADIGQARIAPARSK